MFRSKRGVGTATIVSKLVHHIYVIPHQVLCEVLLYLHKGYYTMDRLLYGKGKNFPTLEVCPKETGYKGGGKLWVPWWRQVAAEKQLRFTL